MIQAVASVLGSLGQAASATRMAAGSGGGALSQDLASFAKVLQNNKPLQAFNKEFTQVQDGFNKIAQQLGPVRQAAGQIAAIPKQLAAIPGELTKPLQGLVEIAGTFRAAVTGLGQQVSQFTQLANPALTQRFFFAADDLTAVLGKSLIPVLEFATKFTRGFADMLNQVAGPIARLTRSVLGPLGDMFTSLVNLAGPVLRTFGSVLDAVGAVAAPFLRFGAILFKIGAFAAEVPLALLAKGFELLLAPLEMLGRLLDGLFQAFDRLVGGAMRWVRDLLGIRTASGSSVGAAVRPAQMSSVESFQNQAITRAFSLGTASSPEEKTFSVIQNIENWLKRDLPGILAGLPAAAAEKLWEVIKNLVPEPAKAVANAVGGAASSPVGRGGIAALVPGGGALAAIGDAGRDAGRYLEENTRETRAFVARNANPLNW